MQNIHITIVLGFLILGITACKDFNDLTKDPNRPTEVNPSLLLTRIEASAFEEVSKSAAYAQRYLVFTDGFDAYQYFSWRRGGYSQYDKLRWNKRMIEEARRTGNENYLALGKFFRAWYFTKLARKYGDVPYKKALNAEEGTFSPTYTKQKDVYEGILQDLEEANNELSIQQEQIVGDVIFEGNIQKWKKLINSFRLRVLMSLSKKAGKSDLNIKDQFRNIVNNPEQYPIMTSNADNAELQFYDRTDNRYPYYNDRELQTATYMEKSFVKMLKSRKDPRLFEYAAPDARMHSEFENPEKKFSSYSGLPAGVSVGENNQRVSQDSLGSPINPRYHSNPVNEPSIALGYFEVKFILAEAAQRGWIQESAENHYNAGIRASMRFYDISDSRIDTYLEQDKVKYDPSKGIKMISIQKHLAFFMNSGWQDFFNQRRTGYPKYAVGPATQNGGKVPTRWMYPQSELDNNKENVREAIKRQYESDNINGKPWSIK